MQSQFQNPLSIMPAAESSVGRARLAARQIRYEPAVMMTSPIPTPAAAGAAGAFKRDDDVRQSAGSVKRSASPLKLASPR
jgi:hypothetical protein